MNTRLVFRWASLVAVGMMLTTMVHAEWKWSGYSQVRYNLWDSEYGSKKPDSDFLIRRARIKAEGPVAADTTITLQMDFSGILDNEATSGPSNVTLKDALITRKINPELSATLGYTQTPFGYEVPSSDSANYLFEKSQPVQKLLAGERDTGLYLHYRPAIASHPQVDLGYSNGMQKWYDVESKSGNRDDASHALVGRVQWPFADNAGLAGASYMWSSRDRGPAGGPALSFDNQDVFGVHARYMFPQNVLLQGEYFDGKYLSDPSSAGAATVKDAKGWYGLATYTFPKQPVTGFFRYDTLDSGDTNDYTRNTFGVAFDRSKSERFSLQFENITDDGKGASFDNWAVQWQVKY